MKNVCFLIGNLNNSGGIERVTTLVANELQKDDCYSIHILNLTKGDNPFFKLSKNLKVSSLYNYDISFKKEYIKTVIKIRNYIKENNIETLIVVDSLTCIFTIPALLGLRINHICWEHFNFNNNNGIYLRDLARKLAAKYCTTIVTLTDQDLNTWKNNIKKIKANILNIYNPCPFERVDIKDMDFTNKSNVFIAIGHITKVKGYDFLIEAWRKLPKDYNNWKLLIIGNGNSQEIKNLMDRIKKYELSNVELHPATREIENYYRNSKFYCLTSRYEGLPMVLIEAQSFGLPIVAFDCETGPRDVVIDGENGYLVDLANIDDFSNRLVDLMNMSKKDYKIMVNKSLKNSERFFINNIILKWKNII